MPSNMRFSGASFSIFIIIIILVSSGYVCGFVSVTQQSRRSSTSLAGLLGRFRKKREVEQVKTIGIGDPLPDGEIEVLQLSGEEGTVDCTAVSVNSLLGKGKTLLVGMPGAFTPTCTAEHLPGYVKNTPKLVEAGMDTIAVLTTNDRYVNEEWGSQKGALATSDLVVLCDGDGDFVKALGMADDMGFGVGVRSKRFVLIIEEGTVQRVVVDEGMDDCSGTSAEAVLKILSPQIVEEEGSVGNGIGVVAAGVLAAALFAVTGLGESGVSTPTADSRPSPSTSRVEKVNPSAGPGKATKSSGFSLLDEFKQETQFKP